MGVLSGKAVVITGSGRGLGRAYAKAAASEGASVVVNDIDATEVDAVAQEIESTGGTVAVSHHSVADPTAAEALIMSCVDAFGRIDALVNNAGVVEWCEPWEVTAEFIEHVVSVNLQGTLYCGIAAMRPMRGQGSGVIVNVTSSSYLGMPRLSLYGATKGAITTLTYTWALELATDGIRVSGFCPVGRTRMVPSTSPLKDGGPPTELVAPAIVYLLSDDAVELSGQIIKFDGEQLSLLSPARFGDPVVRHGPWDVNAISSAVAHQLAPTIQPVGRTPIDLRRMRLESDGLN